MLKTIPWRMMARGCALGVLAGLLVVALESDFPERICEYNQATRHEDCATYSVFPFLLIQISKTLNNYGVAITAVATVAIGYFTRTLWRATTEQGRLTQESIDLARDEFISTQRPRVVIRQIVVWQPSTYQKNVLVGEFVPFTIDEKLHGHLALANIGGTTATVEFLCGIFHCRESPLPMVPPYERLEIDKLDPLIILEAGKRFTWGGLYGDPSNADMINRINIGTIKLYAMGWVRYTDDRNVVRETRFCRIWNSAYHRFSAVDNPDYEYAE